MFPGHFFWFREEALGDPSKRHFFLGTPSDFETSNVFVVRHLGTPRGANCFLGTSLEYLTHHFSPRVPCHAPSRIRQSTRQTARVKKYRGCEPLGGRTDQDDKRTTGAGAEDRDQHHGSNRSVDRSTHLLVAELVPSQARRLFATPRNERKVIRRRSGRAW